MIPEHIVELKIGDILIDTWQHFRIDHDMLSAADSFDMTFGVASWYPRAEPEPIIQRLRAYAKAFKRVEIFIDGAKQLSGIIDTVHGVGGGAGPSVNITGRDLGGQLEDEYMPTSFNYKGITLLDLLEKAMEKWNISVEVGNEHNRVVVTTKKKAHPFNEEDLGWAKKQKWWKHVVGKPVQGYAFSTETSATEVLTAYEAVVRNRKIDKEVRPKPEDTVWDFVSNLLRTQNLLGWFSADGHFIVGLPDYDQEPLFHVTNVVRIPGQPMPKQRTTDMNNVEEGEIGEEPGKRYSAVFVFGRQGKDPIRAEAHDTELEALGVDRPLYHRDKKVDSLEEAERLAKRLLVESQIRGSSCTYKLTGFGQGDFLFAFDTVFDVWDDEPSRWVHDQLFCTKFVQGYDLEQGPLTTVTLQPKGIIEVPTS